jgi:hypothetical protein
MAFLWGLRFDRRINILSSLLVVACGLPDVSGAGHHLFAETALLGMICTVL